MECVGCSLKMHVMRYFWFINFLAYQLNATSYLYENALNINDSSQAFVSQIQHMKKGYYLKSTGLAYARPYW